MTRAITALVVLALALPALAHAQAPQTNAPPGNSAVDEYLETVPGASGNQRPRTPAAPGGASGSALTAAERARLERLGPDGKTLADAVEATAPAPAKKAAHAKLDIDATGGSPARELLDAVAGDDGGGGMGLVLPAILIAALLAAITLVLLRRRASS